MSQTTTEYIALGVTVAALTVPVYWTLRAFRLRRQAGGVLLRWRPPSIRLMIVLWWIIGTVTAVILYNHGARPLMKTLFLCAFVLGFFNIIASSIVIGEKGIFLHRQIIRWEAILSFSFWKRGMVDYMRVLWSVPGKELPSEISIPIPPNRKMIIMTLFRTFIPSIQMEQETTQNGN